MWIDYYSFETQETENSYEFSKKVKLEG